MRSSRKDVQLRSARYEELTRTEGEGAALESPVMAVSTTCPVLTPRRAALGV